MKPAAPGLDTISQDTRVKTDIEILDERLDALDMEEREASRTLEVLRAERRSLEARRAALDVHSQTRSIHSLPPELLLEVFAALILPDRSAALTRELLMRPVVISSVCQLWRGLALSAAGLWSCIPAYHSSAAKIFLVRTQRSPLELVYLSPCSSRISLLSLNDPLMVSIARRVRSMRWQISGLFTPVYFMHNQLAPYVNLQALELDAVPTRRDMTFTLHDWNAVACSSLEELSLKTVTVVPKPDTVFSRLKVLKIDNRQLQLSELYEMLAGMPHLETLVLYDSVPVMDVTFRQTDQGGHRVWWWKREGAQQPLRRVAVLSCLQHLDWSFAPPWDARLLFIFLEAPNLRSLSLCLNTALTRWRVNRVYGDPLGALACLPVTMPALKELSVECVDVEALRQVFRKANMPALARLQLTYLLPLDALCDLPVLPRHESMFRNPRMLALTHLKLSHFTLDPEETKTMLRYVPVLVDLTFLDCVGVGPVVCALSGGTCDTGHENPISVWICPRLTALRTVDSFDLKFICLRGMLQSRYRCSTASGASMSTPTKSGRPPASPSPRVYKPLRRQLRHATRIALPAPPSRISSSVDWDPYAVTHASPLQSICIEGCRISEVEGVSLAEDFSPLHVKWEA